MFREIMLHIVNSPRAHNGHKAQEPERMVGKLLQTMTAVCSRVPFGRLFGNKMCGPIFMLIYRLFE